MKIGIIGAGGVGGFFGAKLAKAGNNVTFLQRGEHLVTMQKSGLRVESKLGGVHLPQVRATDDPTDVGIMDMVLVTVKSGQTEEAGRLAKPLLGPSTGVISLQNGVENEVRLEKVIGSGHVMGGVAYILSLIKSPGLIQQSGPMARLEFGELDGTRSDRAVAFLKACDDASIEATLSEDVLKTIWKKFVFLCPHNGTTGLTRSSIGAIREDPDCRKLLEGAVGELLLLAKAKDIWVDLKGVGEVMDMYDNMPYEMTSSMHYDVMNGKPLELEWLNGAVVRLAREVGIETPLNGFIYAALKLLSDGVE